MAPLTLLCILLILIDTFFPIGQGLLEARGGLRDRRERRGGGGGSSGGICEAVRQAGRQAGKVG